MPLIIICGFIAIAVSLFFANKPLVNDKDSANSQTKTQIEKGQIHGTTSHGQTDDSQKTTQTQRLGTQSSSHKKNKPEAPTISQKPKIPSVKVRPPFSSYTRNSIVVSYEKPAHEADEELDEYDKRPGFRIQEDPDFTIMMSNDSVRCDNNLGCAYNVYQEEDSITYYFEPGHNCVEIKYKNDLVWKHNSDEHLNYYPEKMVFYESSIMACVYINSGWYYSYNYSQGKWKMAYQSKLMKPGSLITLLKHVFDIDLNLSPSWIRFFSRMTIKTIGLLSGLYSGLDDRVKLLINRLYYSELSSESLPKIVTNPDKIPILLKIINGTPLKLSESGLDLLISDPPMLLHLIKEMKSIGFMLDVLLKKLIVSPEKIKVLLVSMKELGYRLNEEKIYNLTINKDVLSYLNIKKRFFNNYFVKNNV